MRTLAQTLQETERLSDLIGPCWGTHGMGEKDSSTFVGSIVMVF